MNGGSTAGDSSISVSAGRYIANEQALDLVTDLFGNVGGDLGAKSVSLTASTFNADETWLWICLRLRFLTPQKQSR